MAAESSDRFVQLAAVYDPTRGVMVYALDASGRVWKHQDGRDRAWRLVPEDRRLRPEA